MPVQALEGNAPLKADPSILHATIQWRRDNPVVPAPRRRSDALSPVDDVAELLDRIVRFPHRWRRAHMGEYVQSPLCGKCEAVRVTGALQMLQIWGASNTPLDVATLAGEPAVLAMLEELQRLNAGGAQCGHFNDSGSLTEGRRSRVRPPHVTCVLAAELVGLKIPPEIEAKLESLALLWQPGLPMRRQLSGYRFGVGKARAQLKALTDQLEWARADGIVVGATLTGLKPTPFLAPTHHPLWCDDWGVELLFKRAEADYVLRTQKKEVVRGHALDFLEQTADQQPAAMELLREETGLVLDPLRVETIRERMRGDDNTSTVPGEALEKPKFPDVERTYWYVRDQAAEDYLAELRQCRDDLRMQEIALDDDARLIKDGSLVAMPYLEWADNDQWRKSAFGEGFEDESLIPDESVMGRVYARAEYESGYFSENLEDRIDVGSELEGSANDHYGAGSVIHDAEAGLAFGAFDVTIQPYVEPLESEESRSKFSYRTSYEDLDADRGAPGLWLTIPEPDALRWRDVPKRIRRTYDQHDPLQRKQAKTVWLNALRELAEMSRPQYPAFVTMTLARLDRRIADVEMWLTDPSGPISVKPLGFDEWRLAVLYDEDREVPVVHQPVDVQTDDIAEGDEFGWSDEQY